MKYLIALTLAISAPAFAQLCESGYCPENGYPPVSRAYEVKHEPREDTIYKPVERPRIETPRQQYDRQQNEPSVYSVPKPKITGGYHAKQ